MKKTIICNLCNKRGHTDKTDMCTACLLGYHQAKRNIHELTKEQWKGFKRTGFTRVKKWLKYLNS